MLWVGGFRSFHTVRRTICGFEAMMWLRKGFGFAEVWTVREQNRLLVCCLRLSTTNKAWKPDSRRPSAALGLVGNTPRVSTPAHNLSIRFRYQNYDQMVFDGIGQYA